MMATKKHHDLEQGALLLLLFLLIVHGLPQVLSSHGSISKAQSGSVFQNPPQGAMSSFHKITLGIPVSVNLESPEALTAIPGIGLQTAYRIVEERNRRGKFTRLDDLKSVKGIGPASFDRMKPFLML